MGRPAAVASEGQLGAFLQNRRTDRLNNLVHVPLVCCWVMALIAVRAREPLSSCTSTCRINLACAILDLRGAERLFGNAIEPPSRSASTDVALALIHNAVAVGAILLALAYFWPSFGADRQTD